MSQSIYIRLFSEIICKFIYILKKSHYSFPHDILKVLNLAYSYFALLLYIEGGEAAGITFGLPPHRMKRLKI